MYKLDTTKSGVIVTHTVISVAVWNYKFSKEIRWFALVVLTIAMYHTSGVLLPVAFKILGIMYTEGLVCVCVCVCVCLWISRHAKTWLGHVLRIKVMMISDKVRTKFTHTYGEITLTQRWYIGDNQQQIENKTCPAKRQLLTVINPKIYICPPKGRRNKITQNY